MKAAAIARQFAYFRTLQKNLRLYETLYGDVCGVSMLRRHVIEEMRRLAKLMRYGVAACALMLIATAALAQDVGHRHHPAADMPLHEKFYSGWYMPDNPTNRAASKPTATRQRSNTRAAFCTPGAVKTGAGCGFQRRRSSMHRDNPDGRNHICAPPPKHQLSGWDGLLFRARLGDLTVIAHQRGADGAQSCVTAGSPSPRRMRGSKSAVRVP
jgi:hypothetical protein